jgi:hypothetical protein
MYRHIKELLGNPQPLFTQVDTPSAPPPCNSTTEQTTFTLQYELEHHILARNRRHSLQSLETLFFTDPILYNAINPEPSSEQLDKFLNGSFLDQWLPSLKLSEAQQQWIEELKRVVDSEISLHISIEDFKSFFQSKQERTTSSPSGQYMGHYRALLDCIQNDNITIPNLIIDIAYTSLIIASPLTRWQTASQLMLEKGKGQYIENL